MSKSNLPIVASTDLDITMKIFNFSISLPFKISILAFSSSIYISSLSNKLFLFLEFYLFVSLAEKSSPPSLFNFSNLCFLSARPSFWFFSDQTLKLSLISLPISKCHGLQPCYSTPIFLPASSSPSVDSSLKSSSCSYCKKAKSKVLTPLSSKPFQLFYLLFLLRYFYSLQPSLSLWSL